MDYYKTTNWYQPIKLPCGAEAEFDHGSGYSYRCTHCGTIWGSVSNPCYPKYKLAEILKDKS
jgi:hypothetical protein